MKWQPFCPGRDELDAPSTWRVRIWWSNPNNVPVMHHYCDVIMGVIVSQITSLMIVYSTIYSSADQRKHQSSTSLAFVWGIRRWPVNSPHKGQWSGALMLLPEASFGLRVLSLPLSVGPSVTKFVCAITHHPFKLGSPNLDQRCKTPWLRSLLFWGTINLDLQGQI